MTLDFGDLTRVRLTVGGHRPNGNACVMEAVSLYAGEPWSDRPVTTDPALAAYLRVVNDRSPQWVRDELALRIPRIARAHCLPPETRWIWAEAARQSAIRALGPVRGESLATCAPIVDMDTARTAADVAVADAAAVDAAAAAYAVDAAVYAVDAAGAAAYAGYATADTAAYVVADRGASVNEWREALALVDRMLDLADLQKEGP